MPPFPRQGHMLSAPGPYRDVIKTMTGSDPRFRQFDPKKIRQKTDYPGVSVPGTGPQVIGIRHPADDEAWDEKSLRFLEGESLRKHLIGTTMKTNQRWTYILEGLGPDFVRHLGEHFNLHPAIFFDHERVVVFDDNPNSGESDSLPLPSILCTRDHYTLKYYETLYMFPKPKSYRQFCKVTGRQIAATRFNGFNGNFNDVGIVRRKVTFWSRKHENGNWDCLIITGPPLEEIGYLSNGTKTPAEFEKVRVKPFQGGYRDFVPEAAQLDTEEGPPRTSMAQDLEFYIRTHSKTVGGVLDGPEIVNMFIQKLVACHYFRLNVYLRSTFSVTQRNYQRQQDFSDDERFGVDATEKQFSDVQTWERRMGEYCSNIQAAMIQLRIQPVEQPDPRQVTHWTDVIMDYHCLYIRFRELRSRAAGISTAITGLTTIAGNRQAGREQKISIEEARNSRVLATLGFVFLPLLFAAGFLSMNQIFLPGGEDFWKYWAIAVPLMYVCLMVVRVGIRWGYTGQSMHWSSRTVWTNFVQWVQRMRPRKKDESLDLELV